MAWIWRDKQMRRRCGNSLILAVSQALDSPALANRLAKWLGELWNEYRGYQMHNGILQTRWNVQARNSSLLTIYQRVPQDFACQTSQRLLIYTFLAEYES